MSSGVFCPDAFHCKEVAATIAANRPIMFRKSWHVHVAREVSLPETAIGSHVLAPGEYVMREIDISSYDIASPAMKVRLGFSHVFRMQRSGAIRIDGVFP